MRVPLPGAPAVSGIAQGAMSAPVRMMPPALRLLLIGMDLLRCGVCGQRPSAPVITSPPALMLLLIRMGCPREGGGWGAPGRRRPDSGARRPSGSVDAGHDDSAGPDAGPDSHRKLRGRGNDRGGAGCLADQVYVSRISSRYLRAAERHNSVVNRGDAPRAGYGGGPEPGKRRRDREKPEEQRQPAGRPLFLRLFSVPLFPPAV